MMDVRVFKDPVYSTAIGTIFAVLFGIYGTMLVVTQYFQNIKDYSAIEAGFLMLALSLPVVVLAPLAGRLVARYGGRSVTLFGVLSIFTGLLVLAVGVGNVARRRARRARRWSAPLEDWPSRRRRRSR